jgi:hypothetical protein
MVDWISPRPFALQGQVGEGVPGPVEHRTPSASGMDPVDLFRPTK